MNIDNTKRGTYVRCHRQYYLDHIKGYTSQYGSTALRYGSTWHGMKEGYYAAIAKEGWNKTTVITAAIAKGKEVWEEDSIGKQFNDDYRTLENCMLSFAMFVEHFAGDEGLLEVIEPEVPFKLKFILSPEEQMAFIYLADMELFFTGKIDLEIKLNGRYWVTEDKTTGQSLGLQSERLGRSAQLIGYYTAGGVIFPEPPEGVLLTMHQLNAYKSKVTGNYGNPKIDFKRVPQIFSEADKEGWRLHFLATADDIVKSIETNVWDKNWDACYTFGRCPYYNLCAQNVPLGEENLEGFITREPWDVLKGRKEPKKGELK